jgi:hypothetical protein
MEHLPRYHYKSHTSTSPRWALSRVRPHGLTPSSFGLSSPVAYTKWRSFGKHYCFARSLKAVVPAQTNQSALVLAVDSALLQQGEHRGQPEASLRSEAEQS